MAVQVHLVTSEPPEEHQWLISKYGTIPNLYLWYEDGGPAHKRNWGVKRACLNPAIETLVFLDDDLEVAPNTIAELVHGLEILPDTAMLFAKILKMDRRDVFDDCGSWLTWTGFLYVRAQNDVRDAGQYNQPMRVLSSKSATCAIRRQVFEQVGGFDATYFILGEETDLSWRCWLAGHEVWYWPRAVSWHAFGTSFKPPAKYYTLARIHRYGCRNYLSMLWTNLGALRLSTTFPLHLSAWLVSALGFALRGQGARAVEIMRGLQDFCGLLPGLQRKRARVQASRTVSDRALMKHIKFTPPWTYYPDRLWRYLVQGLHG